jgi:methionyl-tRNA formyltransferase
MPVRVIFFGTAEFAVPSLAALAKDPGCHVLGVVTQPDRPKGRALQLHPSPVKALALTLGLPVWQPAKARAAEFVAFMREQAPELIVVAAYGQILPQSLLDIPRAGCLNVHGSILPKYRGAAPIQWAILNHDAETGVTIMKMDAGLDTGAIVSIVTTPVQATDNAQTLHDRLAALGAELLIRTLPGYLSGEVQPVPQPATGSTYARKITKEDGLLDWTLDATTLWCRVRGLTPWPGTFTSLTVGGKSQGLKVWRAEPAEGSGRPGEVIGSSKAGLVVACAKGALRLLELQREGGKRLPAHEFLSGLPLPVGIVLGQTDAPAESGSTSSP